MVVKRMTKTTKEEFKVSGEKLLGKVKERKK